MSIFNSSSKNIIEKNKYNVFHKYSRYQREVIKDNNFTYFNVIQSLNKVLGCKNHLQILDYGCGVGTISLYLASKNNFVTGVDISDKAICLCNKSVKVTRLHKYAKFITSSTWEKHNINCKYDLIICVEVIEHIVDDIRVLSKLVRSLKSGGYIVITTPSTNSPLYKWGLLAAFDKRVGHLRRYDKDELTTTLRKLGITHLLVEEKESFLRNLLYTVKGLGIFIKFLKGPLSNWAMCIDDFLVKIYGGSNIYISGIKK